METTESQVAAEVAGAARVLSALRLVSAFGHVSARRGDHLLITPAIDLGRADPDGLLTVPLSAATLPPGAPGEAWIHLAVYRTRPDVQAVVRATPEAAFAAGAVTTRIPPLHGQGAMLGESVPVHDDARLMRSAEIAEPAARTLGAADALVLRGNGAIATGDTPGRAVARMWLLDTTCRLHLTARAAGTMTTLKPDEIAAWRHAAPPLLDRLWAHLRRISLDENR